MFLWGQILAKFRQISTAMLLVNLFTINEDVLAYRTFITITDKSQHVKILIQILVLTNSEL